MNIIERVKAWFGGGPTTETKAPSKGRSKLAMALLTEYEADPRTQESILEAYINSPDLRQVVDIVGDTVGDTDIYAEVRGSRNDDHPLNDILTRPNEFQTRNVFLAMMTKYVDLVGECYLFIMRTSMGVEVFPIPPTKVYQDEDNPLFFKIHLGSEQFERKRLGKDIVRIIRPDLREPYGTGSGLGHTLADEVDISEFAAQHEASFLANHARKQLLMKWPEATGEQVRAFKKAWQQQAGPDQGGGVAILQDSELEILPVSHDWDSDGLINLRVHSRDAIRQAFGVPPEILGDVKNSNRATISAADFLFKTNVIRPRVRLLLTELTIKLIPILFPEEWRTLSIGHDSVVPADKDFSKEVLALAPQTFTVNEVRALRGAEPIEGGDVLLTAPTASEVTPQPAPSRPERSIHRAPVRKTYLGGGSFNEKLDILKLRKEIEDLQEA